MVYIDDIQSNVCDKGPSFETLDLVASNIFAVQTFYFSICISSLFTFIALYLLYLIIYILPHISNCYSHQPCQRSLWEKTGEPKENPRLSCKNPRLFKNSSHVLVCNQILIIYTRLGTWSRWWEVVCPLRRLSHRSSQNGSRHYSKYISLFRLSNADRNTLRPLGQSGRHYV